MIWTIRRSGTALCAGFPIPDQWGGGGWRIGRFLCHGRHTRKTLGMTSLAQPMCRKRAPEDVDTRRPVGECPDGCPFGTPPPYGRNLISQPLKARYQANSGCQDYLVATLGGGNHLSFSRYPGMLRGQWCSSRSLKAPFFWITLTLPSTRHDVLGENIQRSSPAFGHSLKDAK